VGTRAARHLARGSRHQSTRQWRIQHKQRPIKQDFETTCLYCDSVSTANTVLYSELIMGLLYDGVTQHSRGAPRDQ
jgi:hypothetical protein